MNKRTFLLVPGQGVAPISFGVSRENTLAVMPDPSVRRANQDYFLKSAFQIEYDQNGRVVFIQLARRDDWTVLLEGFDVFRTSAEEVVHRIGAIVPYNPSHNRREPGYSFTFPSIGLSFWRQVLPESPDDEDGRYFDAAAVAVSGYWGF